MPKILDLFSGCGGFSLGAHRAGFKTQLAIDVDPILSGAFTTNFPGSKILRKDIRVVDAAVLKGAGADGVDGVVGGPPCQAFSEIGRREKNDPRRQLVIEFFRVVKLAKPKFFVFENVPGLGFSENIGLLEAGLEKLPSHWKVIGPHVLNAADFGAATKRKRLFVFGFDSRKMVSPSADLLVRATKVQSITVRDAIGDLATACSIGEDEGGFDFWRYDGRRKPSPYALRMRGKADVFTGHRKTAHGKETLKRFAKLQPGKIDEVGKHHRLDWDGLCPTLRAGTGSDRGSHQAVRPLHPTEHRVITAREAARLQGFHDSFIFHPAVWHSFRMIGNSVSPIMAQVIMSRISRQLTLQS